MDEHPFPFNQKAANINADDGINLIDTIAIVNIIMQVQGQPCGCVVPVIYDTAKIARFNSSKRFGFSVLCLLNG